MSLGSYSISMGMIVYFYCCSFANRSGCPVAE